MERSLENCMKVMYKCMPEAECYAKANLPVSVCGIIVELKAAVYLCKWNWGDSLCQTLLSRKDM